MMAIFWKWSKQPQLETFPTSGSSFLTGEVVPLQHSVIWYKSWACASVIAACKALLKCPRALSAPSSKAPSCPPFLSHLAMVAIRIDLAGVIVPPTVRRVQSDLDQPIGQGFLSLTCRPLETSISLNELYFAA